MLGINAVDKEASLVDVFFKMLPTTVFLDYPTTSNTHIALSKFLFLLAMVFGFVVVFFSNIFNHWSVWLIQFKPYNLVIGYGVQNQALLSGGWGRGKTIIVESDISALDIDRIQSEHYAIKQNFTKNAIAELDLKNLEKCIISIGGDNKNIAVAIELLDKLDEKKKRRIFVHIENRDLAVLFKQNVIKGHTQNDIVPYSVHEMLIRDLFAKNSLLGLQANIIDGDDAYTSIVIGEGELAAEIVYYLANIAHLPNQNRLTIYCVSETASKFVAQLNKKFSHISSIPHLKLESVNIEHNSLDFYTHKVWQSPRMTNIFVASDDDSVNLDIAINLQDTTYIKKIADEKNFNTKVLFAMHHNSTLAKNIDNDKKLFANFYSFANLNKVICEENIFADKLDRLAKLINFNYDKINDKTTQHDIDASWYKLSLQKKDSNRFQGQHIDIKLLALGLSRIKSDANKHDLLQSNINIMRKKIETYDELLNEYADREFPKSFDNLVDKLARAEHNRWNASSYLYGWQYDKTRNDDAKLHPCLLPIEAFDTKALQGTYKYDLESIIRIPNYLAHLGYGIVDL